MNSGDHIKEAGKTNKEFLMFSQQRFSGFLGYEAELFDVWFPKFVPKLWEPHTRADFSPTDIYVNRNHGIKHFIVQIMHSNINCAVIKTFQNDKSCSDMFRFTHEPSSGSQSQCLAKITGMVLLCLLT